MAQHILKPFLTHTQGGLASTPPPHALHGYEIGTGSECLLHAFHAQAACLLQLEQSLMPGL